MSKWDYEKSYASKNITIDDGLYIEKIKIDTKDQLDYFVCDLNKECGIIKINNKMYENKDILNLKGDVDIYFYFTEKYLETCNKKYIASVFFYPQCDCCVLYREVELSSLDSDNLPNRMELKKKITRHYGIIPSILCNFSGNNSVEKLIYNATL
jgi:hypothetical protein